MVVKINLGGMSLLSMILACAIPVLAAGQSAASAVEEADAAFKSQKWEESAKAYEAITKSDPGNARAWYRLGYSYHSLGKYDDAVTAYLQAAKTGTAPVIMYNLACSYSRLSKSKEALDCLEKAVNAGFTQVSQISSDPDLGALHDDSRFKEIVALASKMAQPCGAYPEYKQFDFWLGEWDVQANGQPHGPASRSSIQRIVEGCVIFENYTQPGGYSGKSFNFYDASLKKWRQTWVDSAGNVGEFSGPYKDNAIWYEGESHMANGTTILRKMTLSKIDEDHIRQYSEASTDGGKTWNVSYDLIYTRKK
jgi:tetratricopeptide (TPR) repeat protein